MKDKIVNAKNAVVDHVSRNRLQYTFVAGFSAATYMFYKIDRVRDWNEFLSAKGLYEEYYNPEEFYESLSPSIC